MASNEAVLVENTVPNLYYLHFLTIGIGTFLNELFQLVQFHLKPSQLDPSVTWGHLKQVWSDYTYEEGNLSYCHLLRVKTGYSLEMDMIPKR